jgi:hypothetical protein
LTHPEVPLAARAALSSTATARQIAWVDRRERVTSDDVAVQYSSTSGRTEDIFVTVPASAYRLQLADPVRL